MDWEMEGAPRRREDEIEAIMDFISRNRHSYASLAVCRRALDTGIERIDPEVISRLRHHLEAASADEIDAYYSIVR